jgi:glycosyltransferase involved in cell wall biosynthesis
MTTASRTPAKRLRILVLTSTFPRFARDTEPRFVLDLCRELTAHADVLVLAPHTQNAALEEEIENVRVRRFRYFIPRWQAVAYEGGITARLRAKPVRALQVPLLFASLWWAVRRTIREWSPDVIHAHWIVPQAFVACLAARGRPPILCTSHGGDLHGLRGRFFAALKAWTLGRCAAVTAVSGSMVPPLRALAGDRPIEVMPMGTDLNTLFVPPPGGGARDLDHLVFVGRLVEKKGVEHLLRAIASAPDLRAGLRLTIAGDGPRRADLESEAAALGLAERVTFLGAVEHRALPALLQRATLAVFPFVVAADGDQEGFGLVVVEAMGCECPVIASDLPAVRQTVEPGVTGWLTAPGDSGALAAAIREALRDAERRRALAAAARARAVAQFDWPSVGAGYLRLMSRL